MYKTRSIINAGGVKSSLKHMYSVALRNSPAGGISWHHYLCRQLRVSPEDPQRMSSCPRPTDTTGAWGRASGAYTTGVFGKLICWNTQFLLHPHAPLPMLLFPCSSCLIESIQSSGHPTPTCKSVRGSTRHIIGTRMYSASQGFLGRCLHLSLAGAGSLNAEDNTGRSS